LASDVETRLRVVETRMETLMETLTAQVTGVNDRLTDLRSTLNTCMVVMPAITAAHMGATVTMAATEGRMTRRPELRAVVAPHLQAYRAFEECTAAGQRASLIQAGVVIWHLTVGDEERAVHLTHFAPPADAISSQTALDTMARLLPSRLAGRDYRQRIKLRHTAPACRSWTRRPARYPLIALRIRSLLCTLDRHDVAIGSGRRAV
jgi:hypothetical protein